MHLLLFVWPPTCIDLHWLWSSSYLFVCKSTKKFHCLATQRKSRQVDHKFLYMCDIYGFMWLEWTCGLANPLGHPSQVFTQSWFCTLACTCIDLHVRLARALLGVESVSLKHCLTIFVRCQIVCRQGNKDLLLRWLRAKPGNEWMNEWMFVLSLIANTLNKDIS